MNNAGLITLSEQELMALQRGAALTKETVNGTVAVDIRMVKSRGLTRTEMLADFERLGLNTGASTPEEPETTEVVDPSETGESQTPVMPIVPSELPRSTEVLESVPDQPQTYEPTSQPGPGQQVGLW